MKRRPEQDLDLMFFESFAQDGEERIATLEEMARRADLQKDMEHAVRARTEIVNAGTWSGNYEKALIAFNWLLAQYDRDPESVPDISHLMWMYKWIIGELYHFPQIPLKQIEKGLADLARRTRKEQTSLRVVHKLRCLAYADMGLVRKAAKYEKLWQAAEVDGSTDCPACEVNGHVEYLLLTGQEKRAIKEAEPLLRGRLRCTEVPLVTHCWLLLPLLRAGKLKQAAQSQRKSYQQARSNRKNLDLIGHQIAFLSVTGELSKAVKLFESRLEWALDTHHGHGPFYFLLGARVAIGRVLACGRQRLRLRLPQLADCHREDGQYATGEVADWLLQKVKALASAFDERNGTDRFARLVKENEKLIKLSEVELPAEATVAAK